MDKCFTCQFYDRRNPSHNDGKGTMWGQCRRTAPMLHPLNAKSYMVEGVWPHVRDDDWCGEWKAAVRRPQSRVPDLMSTAAAASAGAVRIASMHAQSSAVPGGVPPVPKSAALGVGSD
ncbi:MAG TPA: hypothetical protein VMV45_00220 [Casimicrobiaceae bacterium]|nr:hypothetical protein [Casimicrobiaceae bacterium]